MGKRHWSKRKDCPVTACGGSCRPTQVICTNCYSKIDRLPKDDQAAALALLRNNAGSVELQELFKKIYKLHKQDEEYDNFDY